jgi:phosphoribosyl-AMP cyclohydrolase
MMKIQSLVRSFTLLGSLIGSSFFFGCGDNVAKTEIDNKDVRSKGNITVVVTDAETGALIDSVAVSIFDGDTLAKQTANGHVLYQSLNAGSYRFKVEKAGYASKQIQATISMDADGEVPIAADAVTKVELAQLGATVNGTVTESDLDGQKTLLAETEVRLVIADTDYLNREYKTTTDSNGAYSFTNLPTSEFYNIHFAALSDSNGVQTAPSVVGTSPSFGGINFVGNASYAVDGHSLVVLTQNYSDDDLKSSDNITINFSQPVITTEIEIDDIRVLNPNDKVVAITTAWSIDAKTLTISPQSGAWFSGTHKIDFSSGFTFKAINGKSLSIADQNFSLRTIGDLQAITDLSLIRQGFTDTNKVSQNTNSVRLAFSVPQNATKVEIYEKKANDSAFVLFEETTSPENGFIDLSVFGYFDEGQSVEFIAIPVNDQSRLAIVVDNAITLQDKYLYTADYQDFVGLSVLDFDNSSKASLDTLTSYIQVSFDENMDTTFIPKVDFAAPSVTGIVGTWESQTLYRIRPIIAASIDASTESNGVSIDISLVKDLAGNANVTTLEFDGSGKSISLIF